MAYHGFTNYETWCVNLWLLNTPGGDLFIQETVQAVQGDKYQLCEALREHIKEAADDVCSRPCLVSDLLGHAIASVDFHQLAELYMGDFGYGA